MHYPQKVGSNGRSCRVHSCGLCKLKAVVKWFVVYVLREKLSISEASMCWSVYVYKVSCLVKL